MPVRIFFCVDYSFIFKARFGNIVSGMYMGELVRLVLEDCVEEGLLFSGLNTAQLHIPGTFPTKDLSQYQQTEA